jgi:hypothetical protein
VTLRKVVAGAGEHDHPNLVVVDRAVERLVQGVRHRGVLRVAVLGAVHRDDRRGAATLVPHRFRRHGATLAP